MGLDLIDLLLNPLINPGVGILDILVARTGALFDMHLSVLADTCGAESHQAVFWE